MKTIPLVLYVKEIINKALPLPIDAFCFLDVLQVSKAVRVFGSQVLRDERRTPQFELLGAHFHPTHYTDRNYTLWL
jgi:hypothetical protein